MEAFIVLGSVCLFATFVCPVFSWVWVSEQFRVSQHRDSAPASAPTPPVPGFDEGFEFANEPDTPGHMGGMRRPSCDWKRVACRARSCCCCPSTALWGRCGDVGSTFPSLRQFLQRRRQTQGPPAESSPAPCFSLAAAPSCLPLVKEKLHSHSPKATFSPLKATARLTWPRRA